MDLREILNQLLWDPEFAGMAHMIQVIYENRGSVNNEESFRLDQVEKVGKKFLFVNNVPNLDQGMIPLHRIRCVESLPEHRLFYWNYPKDF